MKQVTMILSAFALISLTACENKDYKNCIEKEKKDEAAYLEKVSACSALSDAAKKKDCLAAAESSHFKAGCEALK